jgi:mitogen-activated protein kinase kinase kinase
MEHMQGGSIKQLLKQYGKFDENLIIRFISQIIEGLKYLHEEGVIHSDLKCDNVLSDGEGNIKLSDFGSSKQNL